MAKKVDKNELMAEFKKADREMTGKRHSKYLKMISIIEERTKIIDMR